MYVSIRPARFTSLAGIASDAVDSIAAAIQQVEGYFPGSLAYRNNNPGNLVYAGQPGASPGAGGFAQFSSYDAGLQAMKNQISLDVNRGTDVNGNPVNTLSDLITSWAPPAENDTANYIRTVAGQTGFDPNAPLSLLGVPAEISSIPSADPVDFSFSNSGEFSVPAPILIGAAAAVLLAAALR